MAVLMDGKALSEKILAKVAQQAGEFLARTGRYPGLRVIMAGGDDASGIYMARKEKMAAQCGIAFDKRLFAADCTIDEIIDVIHKWNADPTVDGIMLEMPLPGGLDAAAVSAEIAFEKDVEGVTALNAGNLFWERQCFVPCTADAAFKLILETGVELTGKHAVVVGTSSIVGKPLALMLHHAGATVTMCNIHTKDLAKHTAAADIVCVAVGKPGLLTGNMIADGTMVVDIGINYVNGKITGDAEFEQAAAKASYITPVPGGVGSVTTAVILNNVMEAALRWERKQ